MVTVLSCTLLVLCVSPPPTQPMKATPLKIALKNADATVSLCKLPNLPGEETAIKVSDCMKMVDDAAYFAVPIKIRLQVEIVKKTPEGMVIIGTYRQKYRDKTIDFSTRQNHLTNYDDMYDAEHVKDAYRASKDSLKAIKHKNSDHHGHNHDGHYDRYEENEARRRLKYTRNDLALARGQANLAQRRILEEIEARKKHFETLEIIIQAPEDYKEHLDIAKLTKVKKLTLTAMVNSFLISPPAGPNYPVAVPAHIDSLVATLVDIPRRYICKDTNDLTTKSSAQTP